MSNHSTTIQAAKTYFTNALQDYLGKDYWRTLNEEEALKAVTVAAEQTSNEMDGCLDSFELSDHCVHWLVDLVFKSDDGPVTVELPLNRVSASDTHVVQIQMFLTALVRHAVVGSERLTPKAVYNASLILDEIIEKCEGCKATITLQEAKFSGGNMVFCFRVQSDAGGYRTFITYEVPWPQA